MADGPGIPEPRRGDVLIPFLTVLFDAAAIACSFLLAYWLRFRTSVFESLGFVRELAPPFAGYLTGSAFIVAVWLMIFTARKVYRSRRNVPLSDELIGVVKVVSLGMLVVMSAAFFYRGFSFSRIVFGILWVASIVTVFAGRAVIHTIERRWYRKGRNIQRAVIIGGDALAEQVYLRLDRHPAFGFAIAGYFADAPAPPELRLASAPYLGTLDQAAARLKAEGLDLAFIALRTDDHPRLLNIISECEGFSIEFMMVPDLLELLTSRLEVKELEGIPFLRLKGIPLTFWGRTAKRSFDLAVSLLLSLILTPLLIAIAIAVRLDSPGPILFRQKRIGLDGRSFTMYKFRSMVAGAEAKDHEAGLGLRHDPRRTRVGTLIRKLSLDELPQLLNVLRGDMSLVGPRPERQPYVEKFGEAVPRYLDRHRVKTGVTGWAQVNGLRGDTSIEERVRYDLYYVEHWSFAFDIKILLRTLREALHISRVD
jgi:exopolysaccharide biosynthesis polyprenyl glycosylphosphotransferase